MVAGFVVAVVVAVPVFFVVLELDAAGAVEVEADDVLFVELELDAAGVVLFFVVLVLELVVAGFVVALDVDELVLVVVLELDVAGLVVVGCVVEPVLLLVFEPDVEPVLFPVDDVFGTATVFSFGGFGTSRVYGVSGSLCTSFTVGVTYSKSFEC